MRALSSTAEFLLLMAQRVSPLNYLRSLSGKIVLWATQETIGTVAGAENDALTTPDTKQLATLTYAAYTPGAGWSNSGGQVALHTAGNTATLAQAGLLAVSKTYALTTIISGRTAGTVTPTGGTAISASTTAQVITATGTALVYTPTTDFDGSIDLALVVLKQTGILAWSAYPGAELLDESGASGTATAANYGNTNATLSNPSVGILRVLATAAFGRATQDPFVIGERAIVTGEVRSDGVGTPRLANGGSTIANYTTSTDWQAVNSEFVATATESRFMTVDDGQYSDWRSLSITPVNPVNADTSGATIGQPMGAFGLGYLYDAVNDFLNWYSAEVNSMWNPGEDFSIQIAFTSTSWAAGTATLFMAKVDANNFISITRNAADLIFNYTAGGTAKTVTIATGSPTGNNTAWLTVDISGDALNGYFNGVAGTPATTLGTFVGNFGATTCTVGASSTAGGDPWGGLATQPYICDVVRTQTEITTHSNIAGVA